MATRRKAEGGKRVAKQEEEQTYNVVAYLNGARFQKETLSTDQGPEFAVEVVKRMLKANGFEDLDPFTFEVVLLDDDWLDPSIGRETGDR